MKKSIDINCDLGEGMPNDAELMPYITSANIACGYHAGDHSTIQKTIELCLTHNVAIGAHPSFDDRANFGRSEMVLSENELRDLILAQLKIIDDAAFDFGGNLTHIKPHGALYNMAAKDQSIAKTIVTAILDFNPSLILFGLSGSVLIKEGKLAGLKTANEVFADRTYQENGQLTPRTQPDALIQIVEALKNHVLSIIRNNEVMSTKNTSLKLEADTLCIHGDGPHALEFAKAIHDILTEEGIQMQSISQH